MPADLLLEIGTEEIPAGLLQGALDTLADRATSALTDARLSADRVEVLGTPRRLVVIAAGVMDRQTDVSELVVGPPARIAFDDAGAPTKAAIGFARRNQVDVSELSRSEVEGKQGEYVVCTRREPGKPAAEVLPHLLGELIRTIPWPKSMRWSDRDEAFVRPVHWIVCLLGDAVLPVEFAGILAGRTSRGHRFLAPADVAVTSDRTAYLDAMRKAFVIVDPQTRREMIEAELARIADETGAVVRPDSELLDEVCNLVEYPQAICGSFAASFLDVPEQVIVSAMRSHQRYFAMEDQTGQIVNRFVTIAGTITRNGHVVRAGNERVLAARLADAQFFFREDQKTPFADLSAKLDAVVYQAKLGSMGQKVARIRAIAAELAAEVGADRAHVDRAAALCKTDLVTQMVYEFPDLQGVMGAHYARLSGEPDEVSRAILDHYRPRGAGDAMPGTDAGAVVGIADRIDTLVGCFAAGLAPRGSADPYGLRRAALAILSVLLDRGWGIPLSMMIRAAASVLGGTIEVTDDHVQEVVEFFRTRLKGMLSADAAVDCVEAALSAGFDYVPDARARALALSQARERADFEPLAVAIKRVGNILKGTDYPRAAPDPAVFSDDEERALWQAFGDIERRAADALASGDYARALSILAELKDPVDRFFDAVLVMDEDPRVRDNRLALLGQIHATFHRIADFRQLSV